MLFEFSKINCLSTNITNLLLFIIVFNDIFNIKFLIIKKIFFLIYSIINIKILLPRLFPGRGKDLQPAGLYSRANGLMNIGRPCLINNIQKSFLALRHNMLCTGQSPSCQKRLQRGDLQLEVDPVDDTRLDEIRIDELLAVFFLPQKI